MDEWNQDYQDRVQRLEFFFQRLYSTWMDVGEIDFTKEPPESLERLDETADELVDALVDFNNDIERINENEEIC